MSADSTPLGVIVLNWNNTADTLACLRSLAEWRRAPTVWVVDNASTDGAEGIVSTCAGVRLIRSSVNLGFAGGNNLALEQARQMACPSVLLLNNDARLSERDLDAMLAVLQSEPSIGIIGPVLRDRRPPHRVLSAGGRDIARFVASHDLDLPSGEPLKDVAYVPGTVALIRSAVLERVGLLDERYFFGGELADLCEQARLAGYRSVIHTQTRALHDVDRSSQLRDSLHVYYVFRNRFLFIRKFRPHARRRLFALWGLRGGAMALAALLRGNARRARAIALGVWHGLRGRFGGRNEEVWSELGTIR